MAFKNDASSLVVLFFKLFYVFKDGSITIKMAVFLRKLTYIEYFQESYKPQVLFLDSKRR